MNQRDIRYYGAQILILLIAVSVGVWQASKQEAEIKEDLLEFVKVMSLNVSPQMIESLRGDAGDLENPQYQHLKALLTQATAIETESRFAYVFGIKPDNTLFFYADNEPVGSRNYSPPGQAYTDANPQDLLVFTKGQPQAFANSDAWGNWISVELPIVDETANRVVASLNMDIPQSRYYQQIAFSGIVPLLIGILFALILFVIRRISAKDEMILNQRAGYLAITAHDLKTPLTVIKWTAEILRESMKTAPKDIQDNLTIISNECQEMFSFIDDLANASKTDAGKLVSDKQGKVDLAEITAKVILGMDLLIKQKNLRVATDIKKDAMITGDANALRRAIANLISNAIKYSPQGGNIVISSKIEQGKLIWSIKDAGMGIPKDELPKVLLGYYRAQNAKRSGIAGTGLGLYYVKKIVWAHKGKISLESQLNQGTTATLYFPLPKN